MKYMKKIISMVAIMTMVLFSGCSSKKVDTSQKKDLKNMETTYLNVLKALVTDSTITQAQSDKVLIVIKKPTNTKTPSGTPLTNETTSTDGKQKQQKNNRLSELVTSKVITQAQADTIDKRVKEAMKIAKDATTK